MCGFRAVSACRCSAKIPSLSLERDDAPVIKFMICSRKNPKNLIHKKQKIVRVSGASSGTRAGISATNIMSLRVFDSPRLVEWYRSFDREHLAGKYDPDASRHVEMAKCSEQISFF